MAFRKPEVGSLVLYDPAPIVGSLAKDNNLKGFENLTGDIGLVVGYEDDGDILISWIGRPMQPTSLSDIFNSTMGEVAFTIFPVIPHNNKM